MLRKIDSEFKKIDERIDKMCILTVDSYKNALNVLKDSSIEMDVAQKLEDEVDKLEENIYRRCVELIAIHAPKADDLRKVISLMKIISEIERMADYSYKFVKTIKTENMKIEDKYIIKIEELCLLVMDMFEKVMRIRYQPDRKLASEIYKQDRKVNKLYREFFKDLLQDKNVTTDIEKLMDLLVMVKKYERAGDRIKNIAESIVFYITGERIDLSR